MLLSRLIHRERSSSSVPVFLSPLFPALVQLSFQVPLAELSNTCHLQLLNATETVIFVFI